MSNATAKGLIGLNTTDNNIYSNAQHTTEIQTKVFLTGKQWS